MSVKIKLMSAISLFILMLGVMILGVLASGTQTIHLDGSVNFNVGDKSLWVKSVSISNDNYNEEPITDFMPGYINSNFNLAISDQINSYGAFSLHFEIINTTTYAYSVTATYSGAVSGVSVSANPTQISASSAEITEITDTTPTTQLDITVTNPNGTSIDLSDITIIFEEITGTTITAIASSSEYGSVSGSGEYDIGETVTLVATPQDIGKFIEWRANSATGDIVSTNATYSFELTALSETTYYAIFEDIIIEDFTFNNLTSNTGEVSSYSGTALEVEIPSSYSTVVKDGETIFIEGDTYTVTAIADGVFAHGVFFEASFTSIILPDTLKTIGRAAFSFCSELEYINIPASVTSIGINAFSHCTSLTSITINATTPPTLGSSAIPSNVTNIYVPSASVSRYRSASGWSSYSSIISAI